MAGGILGICDSNPQFADGAPLSPTALEIVGENLRALDEGTRLGGYVFTSLYGQHPEEADEQDQVIWRGGGVWVASMDTLRIVTFTEGTVLGGDTLRIYRGDPDAMGALPATYDDVTLSAGTQTHTIAISGYTEGDPVRLTAEVRHSADPAPPYTGAKVTIVLAELLPVELADAAPALPAFSGESDITGENLMGLAEHVNWLVRRVALRYDPLFILQVRRIGPYCIPGVGTNPDVKGYYGWRRTALHTSLVVRGLAMRVWGGATESIRLSINGSVVQTYSVPTDVGESAWSFTQDVSGYADGSVLRIVVDYIRTAPEADDMPVNRWTVNEVFLDTPTGGASALASWEVRQADVDGADIAAWLQDAADLAQAIEDRIAANDGLWAVQRLYTARPAFDEGRDTSQFQQFEAWSIPGTMRRAGEALVGRGRALALGYGGGYFDEAEYKRVAATDAGIGAYPVKNTRTHPVVDANDVESFQVYLDSAPGLPIGAPYNVRGAESYVLMERLKVVE
jgi:hypothetical protein